MNLVFRLGHIRRENADMVWVEAILLDPGQILTQQGNTFAAGTQVSQAA
jgi:hypothetical protein